MSIPWDAMGQNLARLVRQQPARLVDAAPVSPLAPRRPRRCAFRLRFEDGSVLKGRRLETERQAEEVWRLSSHLDDVPMARPLARLGDALLEEWLAGTPVASGLAHLHEAGDILGRIHRVEGAWTRRAMPVDQRWIAASLAVEPLVDSGLLDSRVAATAMRMARAAAPASAAWGLCHGDVCGENLLDVPGRGLCLIDNETMSELWFDFDLARTWYRWPTTPAGFAAFLEGYRSHRPVDTFLAARPFWSVVVLLRAAQFRVADGSPADVPLARLAALVAEPASCPGGDER